MTPSANVETYAHTESAVSLRFSKSSVRMLLSVFWVTFLVCLYSAATYMLGATIELCSYPLGTSEHRKPWCSDDITTAARATIV